MKIINTTRIYKVELPKYEAMLKHLEELPFAPVLETHTSSHGFIPNVRTGELLTPIACGYSFTVCFDEKILPRSVVRKALADRVKELQGRDGRELTPEEIALIEEQHMGELVKQALIKTSVFNCFYHIEKQFLIVVTASKDLARLATHMLTKCVGSVKVTSIHISDIKYGLTTRLQNHIDGDTSAFKPFQPGDYYLLKEKSSRTTFANLSAESTQEGIREAINAGMQVESMSLAHHDILFKLTNDFALKKIEYFGELTEDEEESRAELDGAMLWRTEAAAQLIQLCAALDDLCELFGYQDETEEAKS